MYFIKRPVTKLIPQEIIFPFLENIDKNVKDNANCVKQDCVIILSKHKRTVSYLNQHIKGSRISRLTQYCLPKSLCQTAINTYSLPRTPFNSLTQMSLKIKIKTSVLVSSFVFWNIVGALRRNKKYLEKTKYKIQVALIFKTQMSQ